MHSDSLTYPIPLPGFLPRPGTRLRIPELRRSPASRLARRLRRTASRGRRIVLGTAARPYEPLVLDGAPLAALRPFDGLDIVVTTGSPEIAEQAELLAELDQRHVVTVDMLIATVSPGSPDLEERLAAVSRLGAEGLTTRLIVAEPPASRRRGAAGLRRFFEAARECRAFDVVTDGLSPVWQRIFDRLRLEHGFPRPLPGRG